MSRNALERHLASWGLRSFSSDAQYFAWQRACLSPDQLDRLHHLIDARHGRQDAAADTAFYDYSADPALLPVLYSQRYAYYLAVGLAVIDRVGHARSILDLGCGPGLLTTFYAAAFPDRLVLGLDRSPACIERARAGAATRGLTNVRFVTADLATWEPDRRYDLVLSTQTLFQTEQDPGLPSRSWDSFERAVDPARQRDFEDRTGLGRRLDRLCAALAPSGRALLFEKTGHLARRVPFQRALAARDLGLLEEPVRVVYDLVEERVENELLYALGQAGRDASATASHAWPEAPSIEPPDELFVCRGEAAQQTWARLPDKEPRASDPAGAGMRRGASTELGRAGGSLRYLLARGRSGSALLLVGAGRADAYLRACGDEILAASDDPLEVLHRRLGSPRSSGTDPEPPAEVPLYENHHAAAQEVWASLPNRRVVREATASEPDGRQLHLELGTSGALAYLYCANTFDQRQLVIMDLARRPLLDAYYGELYEENRRLFEKD